MSTRDGYEPGTPCWVDLMSPDVDTSKAFYTGLFRWDAEDQFDDEGTRIYTNFLRDGQVVAGMGGQMPGMEGAPPVWNTYVAVADVDETTKKVEAAGGTVMMPAMDVMDVGRMAIYGDPTGAAFSVWQAGSHKGADVCNEPNTWSWNELMTRDVDAATAFYAAVFDWTYQGMPMPFGTYHVIEGGDEGGRGGVMGMPPGVPDMVPNHWAVYFMIDDTESKLERVRELGGQVVQGPDDASGVGRITMVHDPRGGSFSMLEPVSRD
jgi:predicted enzyme related to lactoylglutathione lyase